MRYSEQQSFGQCPYKHKLQKDGLRKQIEGEDAHDKNWGQGFHSGLKVIYNGGSLKDAQDAFRKDYPENMKDDDKAKSVESGIECLSRYVSFYKDKDKMWEVLSTEEAGVVSIGGEDHELHIDLVARHKQSGDIYLWDHKTSSKPASPTYWKGFELSAQLTRYVVYVMEKYGSCAGAFINNISVKHLKIRNKYGEGPGFVCSFERNQFNRTKQQIDFWRESDEQWMKLIEHCEKSKIWPKALNKMCAYCEYYELCLSSNDEQIRELLYETKKV